MLIRAGASNRTMTGALGVNIALLYTIVFGIGAVLAALSGLLAGPIYTVASGMGDPIVVLAFVVIVIGGIGSIRGALVGSLLVGLVDTFGRTVMQSMFREFFPPQVASAAGPAVASVAIYVFMAAVLAIKPQGLFPARG